MSKLIFWDWTGTLADESQLDKAVCTSIEKELARKAKAPFQAGVKEYQDFLKPLENTWKWHDYVMHGVELGIDWEYCQEINLDKLHLVPHAEEILEHTRGRGYKNILATNAVREVVLLRIRHAGIDSLLDMIIGSDDVQALKAAGRHFQAGLEKLGGDAKSSYSIGDNPIQDIRPAHEYGMKTIFCEVGENLTHYHSAHISGNHKEDVKPDYRIRQLDEIKSII